MRPLTTSSISTIAVAATAFVSLPFLHVVSGYHYILPSSLSSQSHRHCPTTVPASRIKLPSFQTNNYRRGKTPRRFIPSFSSFSLASAVSSSSSPSTGRSAADIEAELASGVVLEGGETIDFSGVAGVESRAERALAEARLEYITRQSERHSDGSVISELEFSRQRPMGINDDVISGIGHEVGIGITSEDVQAAAALIISRSGDTFGNAAEPVNFSVKETARLESIIARAYVESGEVTESFAKTFFLATQLMSEAGRRAVWAIYVWCRRTDEIVDAPREPGDESAMLDELSEWEVRLENLWELGEVVDVLDLPLLDVRVKYPTLSVQPFVDMLRGMLMDVPNLGQDRYGNFDELHLYCYRVAGTVGIMTVPIFGCAVGYDEETAKEPALSLGVAFQLTNILRDVGEDAVERGRVYLPSEDMEKFGVTEEQIMAQRIDDNYRAFMRYQIDRARRYYVRASRGVPMLQPNARLPVQAALDNYAKILDKIEENELDNLTKRAYVTKW
eukprot:CAMPEP_0113306106 /NCGR_PEP_ID=MMETSP0010_2-20120614/5490_1 /TAXON_ID=216773 ORGANISM="Corethron hystrix, Strain 308" /NCGR_SAMPLE_ID=MMETSP0010_2 /ASSEMBLY_ACC=CAM_ASM_000155 /LENGTH=503 /DNA_ID=CAMNT_0000160707 /DNA_START=344 /DNA_END=1852 /DNA_ORIENTATION=- /assembly_acc=CAM_ASM_000155